MLIAGLDALGVASILPFMGVLANPDLVQTNESLNLVFVTSQKFGIDTVDQFLVGLGALVFLLLITSLVFKAFGTYALTRFALMREYSISKRLVEGYLHQPYSWFLNRHSADLGKTILSEVNTVVSSGMMPLMRLIAQTMVVLALLGLLLLRPIFCANGWHSSGDFLRHHFYHGQCIAQAFRSGTCRSQSRTFYRCQ